MIDQPSNDVSGASSFSDEEPPVFRWWLTRNLGGSRPLVIVGLNPSTADAKANDPTIRTEIGVAKRWGFSWLVKVNAYAFRSTSPHVMKTMRDAGVDVVGTCNDDAICTAALLAQARAGQLVVAWGTHIAPTREQHIAAMISSLNVPM